MVLNKSHTPKDMLIRQIRQHQDRDGEEESYHQRRRGKMIMKISGHHDDIRP